MQHDNNIQPVIPKRTKAHKACATCRLAHAACDKCVIDISIHDFYIFTVIDLVHVARSKELLVMMLLRRIVHLILRINMTIMHHLVYCTDCSNWSKQL
jgi:hypothetical protein